MDNVGTMLKGKTAGLPRWAWLGILTGAVAVGLYLRSRSTEADESSEGEEGSAGGLSEYNGTEGGASMAGAGLVGPASTTLTPVENPVVPAGIQEVLEGLGHVIEKQGETIGEIKTPVVVPPGESGSGGGGIVSPPEITGGGSPVTPPAAHVPPANCGAEISRLEGEINGLQSEIASLTADIKNLKGAKKPNQGAIQNKEQQRNQAQTSVQYKQAKLGAQKIACR